jgi:glycosyltransferase involved in cell wall biosynthesis
MQLLPELLPMIPKMANTSPKQKWLILAYIFNVDGKAASQTITDRMPLLLEKGIAPVVLSGPTGKKDTHFPHHRIFSCMPSGLQYELRFLLKRSTMQKWLRKFFKTLVTILLLPFSLLERIVIHLDTHWSWGINAAIHGLYCRFRYRPDIIYSTAGPSTTHLAAYLLHRISGIPWIAEIHDPLIYDIEKQKWHQQYLFNNWLEKKISAHAAAVIYFTDHALKSADHRHPINGLKSVLRPGATPPVIGDVSYKKKAKMHFGHFGSLATTRNLSRIIEALHDLSKQHPTLNKQIVLDIFGSGLDSISKKTLKKFPIKHMLQEHGRLEYDATSGKSGRQQVFEAMTLCDVQIILHGSGLISDEYVPSKVYEYLLTGRPILALTPAESELGHIVLECGHQVADPDNTDSIKEILQIYIEKWETNNLKSIPLQSPYTIEKTVHKLLDIAQQITK